MGIHRVPKIDMSTVLSNLRIMPSGNIVAAILFSRLHEFAPFDVRVAQYTRIRRAPACVLVHEVIYDMFAEGAAKVEYMVFEA